MFLIVELLNPTIGQLLDFPTDLKLSFAENTYRLVGVTHSSRSMSQRSTSLDDIVHYVAILKRRDNSWVIYDDMKDEGVAVNSKFSASVEVLLYLT